MERKDFPGVEIEGDAEQILITLMGKEALERVVLARQLGASAEAVKSLSEKILKGHKVDWLIFAHCMTRHAKPVAAAVSARKIVIPPGTVLSRALAIVLTRKAYRRYVYPAIAEMQAEYFEALDAGNFKHARWIAIRGRFLILPSWCYAMIAGLLTRIFSPAAGK